MAIIVDFDDPIRKYRENIFMATNELSSVKKKIETTYEDINRWFGGLKLLQEQHNEIMGKMKQLIDCLLDCDNVLYDYQQKLQEYLEPPIG